MATTRVSRPINGYLELASPQLLDDKWRELNFDLASGPNVLQDLVVPESGGGYVYRDAQSVGSASHNRFIYWRTVNDVLELVEMSTEVVLDGSQVRIRFANSPILSKINVIEFSESIVIMVATLTSVHRLHLPHPKTTNKSILYELTNEVLFNAANYYILNNQGSINAQQPLGAVSWCDGSWLKCALSFPDSSILIVQFSKNTHHISTSDIKQIGIIGRLWSRMPNLLAKNPNDCDNAVLVSIPYKQPETGDVLLFTMCRDWKVRVFSTSSRECIYTHNMIPQNSFSQSFAGHTNPTTEQPMMKMFGSQLVIYITENQPEFVILNYSYETGSHYLKEQSAVQTPSWEKLIDFSLTDQKIWALAHVRGTESTLCYLDMRCLSEGNEIEANEVEGFWDFVTLAEDLDMPSAKNYVAEIFWRNHFSIATVQKALVGIVGPSIPKKSTMEALEELAFTRIVDFDQDEAWTRFYNYCIQNHHAANKNLGLVVSEDESLICIIKRSNPSFVCPWQMSVDTALQGSPYRGIEFSASTRGIIEPLNYISSELIDDEHSLLFERKLLENPSEAMTTLDAIIRSILQSKKISTSKLNFNHKNLISTGIDYVCEQLDLTGQAQEYGTKILQESSTNKLRSEHNPLKSNSGIAVTFELFKRLVRARMLLARDLLIYIRLIHILSESEKSAPTGKFLADLSEDLYTSLKVRRILDSLRSYAILVWIAETPIKGSTIHSETEVIDFISNQFKFFKRASTSDKVQVFTLESVLRQNLFMNFLINGGVNFSSSISNISEHPQTISNSFYVTDITLNLCKLLWPKSDQFCFAEFLFTHRLDEHLAKYLELTEDWLSVCEYDRHFLKAFNCLLQNRATHAVDIFNRLWMNMAPTNLIGRFIDLDGGPDNKISVNPTLIYRYYVKLIQLFQINNNHQCLVMLINNCMSLLDGDADEEQKHWVNCFRAKLFQYYLELEDPDEAYHTMVLTSDPSLRINCLRKFIVSHCEREEWSNLLSYPFIDIKNDFIDILNQKADSSDLSKLNGAEFYKTSYYDLLFASYVSDGEFRNAADVMYNYAQRLAHEVPGIISIRKQADCLLIALNALRCVTDKEVFIEFGASCMKEEGRSSVLKRAYDCESESSFNLGTPEGDNSSVQTMTSRVYCKDIEMKYELTRARLRLLERDQTANAIALSPLKAEETIAQLVSSSMFSVAMDLALLFKASMDPILEGLTAKYIFLMRLSKVDVAIHHDLDGGLSDIFTNSYSNIDTYNYIANSTGTFAEKLWRLIDYYLISYDGISHRYSTDDFSKTFAGTTVLMRIVATKLLSTGHDVPASLKRMYMTRNTAELLKLLMKYDKLVDAADLAIEMMDRILEPSNCFVFTSPFTTSDPPPLYLPTHLIQSLISFLNEDATNTLHVKIADTLSDRLNKFRRFVKSS